MKLRILKYLLVFCLVFSLVGFVSSVYAGSVARSGSVHNEVSQARPPNGNTILSASEFADLIIDAFLPDESGSDDPVGVLVSGGHVTGPEEARLRDGDVNWIMAWRICLCLSGEWPLPEECFPWIAPQDRVMGVYADARATAIAMGLADESTNGIVRMRSSEFKLFLDRLVSGDYEPLAGFIESLPQSDLIDFESSELGSWNHRAWAGWFTSIGDLPEHWVNKFREDGWKFVFATSYVNTSDEEYGIKGGLTDYSLKRIYLNHTDERGTYHEFGHYVSVVGGYRQELPGIFEAESEAMRPYLGDYAFTNESEYFAECFAFWFIDPDGPAVLESNSPGIYEIISEIMRSAAEPQAA